MWSDFTVLVVFSAVIAEISQKDDSFICGAAQVVVETVLRGVDGADGSEVTLQVACLFLCYCM